MGDMSNAAPGQPRRDEVRQGMLRDLISEVLDEDAFWNDGQDVEGSVDRVMALIAGDTITLRHRPSDGGSAVLRAVR